MDRSKQITHPGETGAPYATTLRRIVTSCLDSESLAQTRGTVRVIIIRPLLEKSQDKTVHIPRYTEPFSTILQSFESPDSQLSNHCKIVENGSVYRKIWSISVLPSGRKFSSRLLPYNLNCSNPELLVGFEGI